MPDKARNEAPFEFKPSSEFLVRQKRLEDALNLRKPDRVPVVPLMVHFYPTRAKRISNRDAMFETEKTIEIETEGDSDQELDETIIIELVNPSADATIGTNASHTYTILDDDDEAEPIISGFIPAQDFQVPRDTIIQVRISDEMICEKSGVDLETVSITVEGDVIYDGANETDPNVYDSTAKDQTVKVGKQRDC